MDLAYQIESIVGANNVSNKPFVLWTYSKDASAVEGGIPGIVVMPKTVEEVQAIMKLADDTKTPVFPRGSGTSLWGAVPVEGAIVVDMARMDQIKKIDEEVLTCVTEPGITFGELDAILAKSGYRFLVAPENAMSGTVGGHFASHGSGTGSVTYGLQGDCVIGLKVVLPNGQLLATGSAAHPHNPRHYARYAYANDLTGLFCGSEGTLGTFTEVALKIEREPEALEFAEVRFNSFESTFAALDMVRRVRIPLIKTSLAAGRSLDYFNPKGKPHPKVSVSFVIEGDVDVIGIYKKKLLDIVQKYGEYIGDELAKFSYRERWRTPARILTHGVRVHLPVLFPAGRGAADFSNRLEELCDELEQKYKLWMYGGGGFGLDRGWLIGIGIIYDESDPIQWENARQAQREITDRAYKLGASPYRVGTYWAEYMRQLGPHYDVLKKIKEALDPNHIMSPGVLGL